MTAAPVTAKPNPVPMILGWVLKVLLAAAFAMAALGKLSGQPMMVAEFQKIGLGQPFRYFTGAVEIVSAALLLYPKTAFFGAVGMVCVCLGALVAQLGPLHGDVIHVFVLGGLSALAAWVNRPTAK